MATAGITSATGGVCPAASQNAYVDTATNQIVFQVKVEPVPDSQINGFPYVPPDNTDPIYSIVDGAIYGSAWKDPCPLQYPHYNWSYFTTAPMTDVMQVGFDMRTMTTVMALNLGITDLSIFTQTQSMFGPLAYVYGMLSAGPLLNPLLLLVPFCLRKIQRSNLIAFSLSPSRSPLSPLFPLFIPPHFF